MAKKRILACLMATLVAGSLFVGCGGASGSDSKGGKEITIWTKVKDGEMKTIEEQAKAWGEKTGNTVKVVNDEGEFQDYLQAANSSKGPDIYIGMPHDNLASFYEAGLLEEVPDGKFDKSKYSSESVWNATAFVSAKSENKDLAFDFLSDLIDNKSEELFKVGNRIPVLNDVLASDAIKENKYLQGFVDQSKVAVPMPNILEMQAVWNATSQITRVYKGEDAKKVAEDIVSAVKKGIETQQ